VKKADSSKKIKGTYWLAHFRQKVRAQDSGRYTKEGRIESTQNVVCSSLSPRKPSRHRSKKHTGKKRGKRREGAVWGNNLVKKRDTAPKGTKRAKIPESSKSTVEQEKIRPYLSRHSKGEESNLRNLRQ